MNKFVNRENLSTAFKLMRKAGLIARQNFTCCSSCGGYAMAERVKEMTPERRTKVKGCVFYHSQDAARLREGGNLYLGYGPVGVHEVGDFGLPTEEVGALVVKALASAGLSYEWDGKPSSRIEVIATQGGRTLPNPDASRCLAEVTQ